GGGGRGEWGVRSSRVHGASGTPIREWGVPHGLPAVQPTGERPDPVGVPAGPRREPGQRREPQRHPAGGFGLVLSGAAGRRGCGVRPAFHRSRRWRAPLLARWATRRHPHPMTSAIGRSGGRVVGLLVALLTARSPVRLTAQSAGTLLAVLPGSARAAGMGGAGA